MEKHLPVIERKMRPRHKRRRTVERPQDFLLLSLLLGGPDGEYAYGGKSGTCAWKGRSAAQFGEGGREGRPLTVGGTLATATSSPECTQRRGGHDPNWVQW